MESSTPLVNEYKLDFFWKRFPQTILGGVKLKLGFHAPAYIYIGQILLFILPWAIGGIFTALAEYAVIGTDVVPFVYGGVMFLYVVVAQILAVVLDKKKSTITALTFQNNLLSEEDEIEFESCCGLDSITFVITRKKYIFNVVFHALLSGPMCGQGLVYLLPQTLNTLYSSSAAATVIIFILGWFTLCIAQYPLTTGAPPEPATFRTSDVFEFMALLRPFYVYLFIAVDIIARFYSSFTVANQVLHVVFIFLPVFWTAGLLPPVDAFFLWLLEQILVHGFGGSATASDVRLVLMTVVSTSVFIAGIFIQSSLTVVIIFACTGYILSTDLGYLGSQTMEACLKTDNNQFQPRTGFLWKWGGLEIFYHLAVLILVGGLTFVIQFFSSSLPTDLGIYIGYCVFAVFIVEHSFSNLQMVYTFFGFFRSKLYPKSVQRTTIFRKRKKILAVFGWIRRLCLNWVGPFLMLSYLAASITRLDGVVSGTSLSNTTNTSTVTNDFITVIGSVRALRWVWQDTTHSLIEISVVHLRGIIYPNDPVLSHLNTSAQLLLVGFCRDRFYQLYSKLYFYIVLLITSYSEKKQRRKSSASLIVLSCLFFPVVFAVIVASTVISAPLLPLFTLPIVIIGFVRPQRFWPSPVGSSANTCPDSVFYNHLTPQLSKALRKAFALGSLGSPEPGNHYLARFQDRMMWINVLERGHAFCTLSIKGLEMQETSCHTVEAGRIDEMFEEAFELENGVSCCKHNPYPLNTLTPLDAVEIETYSDAKNVLTGIIDSPDNLEILNRSFIKSLVWVLLRHTCDQKSRKADSGIDVTSPSRTRSAVSVLSPRTNNTLSTNLTMGNTSNNVVRSDQANDSWATDSIKSKSRPATAKSRLSHKSMSSLGDWSDDNESLALEPMGNDGKPKVNLLAGLKSQNGTVDSDYKANGIDYGSKRTPATKLDMPGSVLDDWDDTDDLINELDFGLPAVDINQPKRTQTTAFGVMPLKSNNAKTIYNPVTNLAGSMQFSSPYSSRLSLPLKWRELPIEQSQLNTHIDEFPREWFQHVLSTLDLAVNGRASSAVAADISSDDVLVGIYAQITMACYAIVNVLGLSGVSAVSMGPSHVFKVYSGDIPWSPSSDWLTGDAELMEVVLKAYRYAVKMMVDQAIMGEATSVEEVQEYLEDYEQNMFIGLQTDKKWHESITLNKPSLFALGHDAISGTYNSRVLTLAQLPVYIGKLNKETVHSQWANLSLELFYFTNDDDERYSIQAHPTILRNLTVQAADPPLGYPIFASEPISVPTL